MAKSKNKLLSSTAAQSIPPTIVSPSAINPTNNQTFNYNSPSTPSSAKPQTNSSGGSSIISNEKDGNSFQQNIDLTTVKAALEVSPTTLSSNPFNVNDSVLNDNLLINEDIIGHEIPTPECLPRKHSNIQSKLATTTSSSSIATTATQTTTS